MDKYLQPKKRRLVSDLADEFLREADGYKPPPRKKVWLGWSKDKKKAIADTLHQTGYSHLKL